MISLIGEQPLPNLLPIRRDEPKDVVLAYTEGTRGTENVKIRLEKLLRKSTRVHPLQVRPFDIRSTEALLRDFITNRGWKPEELVFNLTGGTKAMAIAAYELAETWHSRFLYLQSEATQNVLYRYCFDANGKAELEVEDVIPGVINLDDYLRIHLEQFTIEGFAKTEGGKFEEVIAKALERNVDEIVPGVKQYGGKVDVDLVLRCGNQVGLAEVKTGTQCNKADGMRHLNSAGQRQFLGTYAKKLLIQNMSWDPRQASDYRDLTKASDIKLIVLPSYQLDGDLSTDDRDRLIREVTTLLRG